MPGLADWSAVETVYADHHQPNAQRRAIAAVQAWVDAANAHNLGAVWQETTPNWQWESAGRIGRDGPVMGGPLNDAMLTSFKQGFRFATLGSPVALSGTKVEVAAHVTTPASTRPESRCSPCASTNGALKVAELIWAT